MSEPLSLDRFRSLAESYGGTIAHWPMSTRDAASALVADQAAARTILEKQAALDGMLGLCRPPRPAPQLRDAILLSARRWHDGFRRRLRFWWVMASLAAALAGVASGSLAAAAVVPQDQAADEGTAFGDLGGPDN